MQQTNGKKARATFHYLNNIGQGSRVVPEMPLPQTTALILSLRCVHGRYLWQQGKLSQPFKDLGDVRTRCFELTEKIQK